jgi:hypothetical protein
MKSLWISTNNWQFHLPVHATSAVYNVCACNFGTVTKLTRRRKDIVKDETVVDPFRVLPEFYWNRTFITVLTIASPWVPSWVRKI